MISWPVSIQEYLNTDNFKYEMGNNVARSEMQYGPAKIRKINTRRVDKFSCSITIPKTLWDTFDNFYTTTLNGGVEQFEYMHPLKDVMANFRIAGEPTVDLVGTNHLMINMVWEVMP